MFTNDVAGLKDLLEVSQLVERAHDLQLITAEQRKVASNNMGNSAVTIIQTILGV